MGTWDAYPYARWSKDAAMRLDVWTIGVPHDAVLPASDGLVSGKLVQGTVLPLAHRDTEAERAHVLDLQ